MGKVVMHNVVSVDGFIADEHDGVGPLFDWYGNGDHELDGGAKVSQASYDYLRPAYDALKVTIVGRHVFDLTNGWDGRPPMVDHMVVVSHLPKPEGWHPDAPYHFVDNVEDAAGLVDEVSMDVVPVVFGSGKRYFGSVDSQHLLEDPDVVVEGDRVLHLRYRVRR